VRRKDGAGIGVIGVIADALKVAISHLIAAGSNPRPAA
jgi:hypothetical protein